jgi:hypothetical protein
MLIALLLGLSWAGLNRAASEAIKANDYVRLKAVLLELRPLMPGNPRVMYNLAASHARLGDTAAIPSSRASKPTNVQSRTRNS